MSVCDLIYDANAEGYGWSARFDSYGTLLDSSRQHVYIHEPSDELNNTEWSSRMDMLKYALLHMRAPPIAFEWFRYINGDYSNRTKRELALGYASTEETYKFYILLRRGPSLPNLPLSPKQTLHQWIPRTTRAETDDVISAEWKIKKRAPTVVKYYNSLQASDWDAT